MALLQPGKRPTLSMTAPIATFLVFLSLNERILFPSTASTINSTVFFSFPDGVIWAINLSLKDT